MRFRMYIYIYSISMYIREHRIIAIKVKADLRVSTLVSCGMYQVFLICPRRGRGGKGKEGDRNWWKLVARGNL